MRTSKVLLPLIGLSLVGALGFAARDAREGEEKVTLDQVPAAVKATILKESAGAKITEIERETKNGKVVYEAEFTLNGQKVEIKIAADGTLLDRGMEDEGDDDDDLTIDQVPPPARAALLKLAGGATISKAGREKEDGVVVYEAEWTVNGVQHEAAVMADGTLLETEETVPVESAPAAVRAAIAKHFGADAKVTVEKKMIVVYEVVTKVDGKERELVISPTGKIHKPHGDDDHKGHDKDADDDDDEDDGNDDNGADDDD